MKTTATTEAVSSSPEENELWSQQWRQNTSHAGQKPRADWKNVLQIPGAGRKSRKPPTPFVGYKLNGKSKFMSIRDCCRQHCGSRFHPSSIVGFSYFKNWHHNRVRGF